MQLFIQEVAFVTFKYPPLFDKCGDCLSHYILLIADPVQKTLMHIDSRGKRYVRSVSDVWARCLDCLISIFKDCKWHTIVKQDLQAKRLNDNFCQTWSLIIGINLAKGGMQSKLPVSTMNDYKMDGFKYIIDFWKEMVKINHIREGIYYEIYCRTHDKNGSRTYDRYFSTLEYLVTTSCSNVYYPHNVSYEKTGFTFIEEFIERLSSEKFSKILK